MRVWSKFQAGLYADLVEGEAPDARGHVPALITDPEVNGVVYVLIKADEWSDNEVVPMPPSVPDIGYAVVYGSDPALPQVLLYLTEGEAQDDLEGRNNAFGYVPVAFNRNGMIPKK